MIVTLTPNPSLDLTYELKRLSRAEVQRARSVFVEAGGKGVNVCRSLVANGVEARAVFPAGGGSGEQFLAMLREDKVPLAHVPVSGELRINTSLVEDGGEVTKVNAPGPLFSKREVELLLEEAADAARGARWLVACGSLPPGAPPDFYARLTRLGHRAGCRVAVDTSGEAHAAALEAAPDLIKPNHEELCELGNRPLGSLGETLEAARQAREAGAGAVLVSLGADGALLVDGDGALHAETPPFTPSSTVGAGDALLAGFLAAGGRGREALVQAVAWGAAAARSPGTRGVLPGEPRLQEVLVSKEIDIHRKLQGKERS